MEAWGGGQTPRSPPPCFPASGRISANWISQQPTCHHQCSVIFGNIQEIAKNALFINCLKCGCKGIIAHHNIQAKQVLSSSNVKAPPLGCMWPASCSTLSSLGTSSRRKERQQGYLVCQVLCQGLNICCVCALSHSLMPDSANPWTVAHQAPLSMGFSRQEYWSGLPFPPPGDLSDPRTEFLSRESLVLAGRFFFFLTIEPTWNFLTTCCFLLNPLGNPYAFSALYSKDTDAQRGDAANPRSSYRESDRTQILY